MAFRSTRFFRFFGLNGGIGWATRTHITAHSIRVIRNRDSRIAQRGQQRIPVPTIERASATRLLGGNLDSGTAANEVPDAAGTPSPAEAAPTFPADIGPLGLDDVRIVKTYAPSSETELETETVLANEIRPRGSCKKAKDNQRRDTRRDKRYQPVFGGPTLLGNCESPACIACAGDQSRNHKDIDKPGSFAFRVHQDPFVRYLFRTVKQRLAEIRQCNEIPLY